MEHNSNCHVEPVYKPVNEKDVADSALVTLSVNGMGCINCVARVRNALLRLDGVIWADIDLDTGLAKVAYDEKIVSPNEFVLAVDRAGRESHHNYAAALMG